MTVFSQNVCALRSSNWNCLIMWQHKYLRVYILLLLNTPTNWILNISQIGHGVGWGRGSPHSTVSSSSSFPFPVGSSSKKKKVLCTISQLRTFNIGLLIMVPGRMNVPKVFTSRPIWGSILLQGSTWLSQKRSVCASAAFQHQGFKDIIQKIFLAKIQAVVLVCKRYFPFQYAFQSIVS